MNGTLERKQAIALLEKPLKMGVDMQAPVAPLISFFGLTNAGCETVTARTCKLAASPASAFAPADKLSKDEIRQILAIADSPEVTRCPPGQIVPGFGIRIDGLQDIETQ